MGGLSLNLDYGLFSDALGGTAQRSCVVCIIDYVRPCETQLQQTIDDAVPPRSNISSRSPGLLEPLKERGAFLCELRKGHRARFRGSFLGSQLVPGQFRGCSKQSSPRSQFEVQLDGLGGGGWQRRPAEPGSLWRVENAVEVPQGPGLTTRVGHRMEGESISGAIFLHMKTGASGTGFECIYCPPRAPFIALLCFSSTAPSCPLHCPLPWCHLHCTLVFHLLLLEPASLPPCVSSSVPSCPLHSPLCVSSTAPSCPPFIASLCVSSTAPSCPPS